MSDLNREIQITFNDGTTELRSGWSGSYYDAPSCSNVPIGHQMGQRVDVDRDPSVSGWRRERVTVYVESKAEREARIERATALGRGLIR